MLKRWFTPSFADLVFAALFAWMFLSSPDSLSLLLKDSDTGWHIRTGQWILDHRQVPYVDPFSFTRLGDPWFAWEWGADVILACIHGLGGLALVSLASGLLILCSMLVLLRWMIWRGSSVLVAFPLILLTMSGSSLHFLARPHLFSILFFVTALWLFDSDRRTPSKRIWLLVPLSLLWANFHGAWPILFILGATHIGACIVFRDPHGFRLARVLAACLAITFVNPYGWHLHEHLFVNVSWKWIIDFIDEYQSPRFRSESLFHFELLLLAGAATAYARCRRGASGLAEALTVWLWAHMSLNSVRHIPLFLVAAAPVIASEFTILLDSLWQSLKKSSVLLAFQSLDFDLRPRFAYNSAWLILMPAAALALIPPRIPTDFPSQLFPVEAARILAPQLAGKRVYSSDQWGGYLIYKLWPANHVFLDGRIDLYGPALGRDYMSIAAGSKFSTALLDQYRIEIVMSPPGAPLAELLRTLSDWQLIHSDSVSLIFRRAGTSSSLAPSSQLFSPSGLMKAPPSSEGIRENRP